MKKKDGQHLQRLICTIESARNAGLDVKIESPKRIRDKITGKMREHDVVLTFPLAHREVVIALECRDRSRKVGVDAVEAFRSKCESTDIHSGIIVSANGFTKTAVTKGAGYNIECLTLDQVESIDWCLASSIFVLNRIMTGYHMYVGFPEGTDTTGILVDENDVAFTKDRVGPIALRELRTNAELPETPGDHVHKIRDDAPALYMKMAEQRTRAREAIITLKYTVKETYSPFEFRKYFDLGKSKAISEAAVAPIPIGSRTADLVLSTNDDGSISVSLVAGPKNVSKALK
jgi:hypothetical protein